MRECVQKYEIKYCIMQTPLFPLIRPHDERSSMMTVRTKFAGEGATDEKEFVNRRVLVYTCSRRNVVLDYSASENASVQVDDTV